MTEGIDIAAASSEIYEPSAEVVANANVPNYLDVRKQAYDDPVSFWEARAKELIDWYEPYTQALR
ncbi:MAG: acetyl-coenzyme A synthetase N-terminal domain-containing protein [Caldilineaceae bacterium]